VVSRKLAVASRSNPTFKTLRELVGSGRDRRRQGRTVLDGPHLVRAFLEQGGQPVLIGVSTEALDDPEVARLVQAGGCEVVEFAPELFRQLSPVQTPAGILALIGIPAAAELPVGTRCIVLLDAVQDPGNAGTIIRSAAAAGADAVLFGPDCADAWSPRVLRAAMGGHFSIAVHAAADLGQALHNFPGRVLAAEGRGGMPPYAHDLTGPVALLLGAEGRGLHPDLLRAAHARISIPLARGIESLNVAAAAAVILFERVRQLGAHPVPGA